MVKAQKKKALGKRRRKADESFRGILVKALRGSNAGYENQEEGKLQRRSEWFSGDSKEREKSFHIQIFQRKPLSSTSCATTKA